jgi:hypothetical protein
VLGNAAASPKPNTPRTWVVVIDVVAIARDPTQRALVAARVQLERHARTIAAVILILLAAVLMRNGIAGLTS